MYIAYIPMARGFVYLAAMVDWFSRRVLAWRVSIDMAADFCVEALEGALAKYGRPKTFNTDQGSQFTSAFRHVRVPRTKRQSGTAFTSLLLKHEIEISRLARQRFRRAHLAFGKIRGGPICEPTAGWPRHGRRLVGIWISTTASGRIRALTHERRTKLTSTTCRWQRQHEFCRRSWDVTPVGLRPRCVTPHQRYRNGTGSDSTYRRRNAVQMNSGTSQNHTKTELSRYKKAFGRWYKAGDYVDRTTDVKLSL